MSDAPADVDPVAARALAAVAATGELHDVIMIDPAFDRRRRLGALKHRPWFLRRRKPGVVGPVVRISGEELIARN